MANTINGDDGVISGSAGLKSAADATGILALQTNGTTRFQIGAAGQLGIGGATYGTSGQVLTSGGASAAPTWTTVSGSSQWTTSGSQVYFTGSIGVGTSAINSWYVDNKAIDMPSGSVFSYSTTNLFIGQNTFVNASGTQVAKNTGASAVYGQSAGIHQFASAPSVSANSTQTFTTVLEFGKGKTLALESATSVSGTGISFPSTQSASSDANTLDDYEEGSWTPAIEFDGASVGVTYNAATGGRYVKIGKTVWVFGLLELTNKGSSSGSTVKITGLPFAVSSSGETGDFTWAAGWFQNITFSGTLALWGGSGGNPRFVSIASNSVPTQLSNTAFANTSSIMLNFCYQTSN
jgi:hypothetical protein